MFETRPENQKIEYMYFGASQKMPSGETIKSGDSVNLKFKQYDVEVAQIVVINETSFSGIVKSISNNENGKDVSEVGNPLKIQLNSSIQFTEDRIFHCTRKS